MELLRSIGIIDIEQYLFMPDGNHLKEETHLEPAIWMVIVFSRLMESLAALPARADFIRMAASMLPDDDEPVVRLDPRLRNNAPLRILDAWKSFDRSSRTRFWTVQARVFAVGAVVFLRWQADAFRLDKSVAFPMLWFNSWW